MSYWCEKCTRLNYGDEKCDFCGHEKKDNSKTYYIPNPKKARTIQGTTKIKNLTKCMTCNKEISNNAEICPRCGQSMPHGYKRVIKQTIGIIILAVIVYLIGSKMIEDSAKEQVEIMNEFLKKKNPNNF